MIRSPGIRQSSKYNSVVGEPLMPSLRSLGPTVKPGSSLCTMNAEIPLAPLSGSVTVITVYQLDLPPLVIQHLAPLSTHSSPSRRARVRIAAASLPASRSDSAYDAIASPEASVGSTCFFSSSEPRRIRPIVPSLLTAGISDADASTRATSSITMQVATESAPCPPYSSGTCTAEKPDSLSALSASSGNRAFSSTSAACGAISFSHRSRSTARNSLCSSGSLNKSNDGLPAIRYSLLLASNFTLGGYSPEQTVSQRRILFQHVCLQLLLKLLDPTAQRRVGRTEDAHGEQAGVAGAADRHRGHWDAGRHLHDRQQRVEAVELLQRHRHTDHRQRGRRSDHPGQVCGATGPGDDDLDATPRGGPRVIQHPARRPVRGDDADLERHVELGQRVRSSFHHRPVAVAAHDEPDPRAISHGCPIRRSTPRATTSVPPVRPVHARSRHTPHRRASARPRC